MTADLAEACATITELLPIAQALITEPDTDGTTGHGQPGSRPPWNSAAASAAMDAHEGIRRLEASIRMVITGHPGPRRGPSDACTASAIKSIESLGHGAPEAVTARAAAILRRWGTAIEQLPAIDEAEPWRRIPAECPYCRFTMLRVAPRAGTVTCLRYGACRDTNGQHPIGHVYISQLTGDPRVHWQDGLVAP